MSSFQQIYVHLGLPKAASTKFQKEVFPHIFGIDYPQAEGDTVFSEFVEALQIAGGGLGLHTGLERGAVSDEVVIEFKKRFRDELSEKSARVLYSDEYFLDPLAYKDIGGMCYALELLNEVLSGCKVLIYVRRQDAYSRSQFGNFVKKAGLVKPDEFIKALDENFFDYEKIYDVSCEVFGDQNCLIIPYELFFENESLAYEHLSRFLGVELCFIPRLTNARVNAAPSDFTVRGVTALRNMFRIFSFFNMIPGARRIGLSLFRALRHGINLFGALLVQLNLTRKYNVHSKIFDEIFERSIASNARLAEKVERTGMNFGMVNYFKPTKN